MKLVHVRGPAKKFVDAHQLQVSSNILGVYVGSEETAYIFLDEIADEAKKQWLMNPLCNEFKGQKGLQRFYLRIRRLIEYHEYGHYLQHMKDMLSSSTKWRVHNEHVADRYAQMRYLHDYGRPSRVKNSRKHLTTQEVLG